jgi:allophanate hydrolase
MEGLPLNGQLRERGARFLRRTTTAPCYRLYALAGGPPKRPGLVRDETSGAAIEVEIWEMPENQFGSFMQLIPSPLGIGSVELQDGNVEKGFMCESYAVASAEDITHLGGWRAYLDS